MRKIKFRLVTEGGHEKKIKDGAFGVNDIRNYSTMKCRFFFFVNKNKIPPSHEFKMKINRNKGDKYFFFSLNLVDEKKNRNLK